MPESLFLHNFIIISNVLFKLTNHPLLAMIMRYK